MNRADLHACHMGVLRAVGRQAAVERAERAAQIARVWSPYREQSPSVATFAPAVPRRSVVAVQCALL